MCPFETDATCHQYCTPMVSLKQHRVTTRTHTLTPGIPLCTHMPNLHLKSFVLLLLQPCHATAGSSSSTLHMLLNALRC